MKRCDMCKVYVKTKGNECPLCQNLLLEGESFDIFPYIKSSYQTHSLFLRILLFLSIVGIIVSFSFNYIFFKNSIWSIWVLMGIICGWAIIITTLKERRNLSKNVFYQVILLSVFALLWDSITGFHGWSYQYVIPFLFVFAMIIFPILAKITHMAVMDYMIYVVIDIVLGVIPLILLLFGSTDVIYPSIISVAVSAISLAFFAIFEGGNLVAELKRRFHI